MKIRLFVILYLVGFLAISATAIDSQLDDFELADRYIHDHSEIAISEMLRARVPASIKLAQGMLESDWGRSDLAVEANNHFGIKCGSQWDGDTFYKEDDDKDHKGNKIKSCFRSFDDVYQSYIAHSDFLADPRKADRYGHLFELDPTDYKAWANGLRKSGYATDPKYPQKLIQIIEKYNLTQFDNAAKQLARHDANDPKYKSSSEFSQKQKESTNTKSAKNYRKDKINKLDAIYADGSSSIAQIAKALSKDAADLLMYNELFVDENYVPATGIAVYLQRKKSSYDGKNKYHIVAEGETMASIAHNHGMKLKSLYVKNRMPDGAEPILGEKLNLYRTVSLGNRPKYTTDFINDSELELLFLDDPTLR